MAQLDIAERRLPQDGRIKIKWVVVAKWTFESLSCRPCLVRRSYCVFDKSNLQLDMTKLGFEPDQIDIFKEAIYKPYGMLVTGPTGSGKTTTLYSAISDLKYRGQHLYSRGSG